MAQIALKPGPPALLDRASSFAVVRQTVLPIETRKRGMI